MYISIGLISIEKFILKFYMKKKKLANIVFPLLSHTKDCVLTQTSPETTDLLNFSPNFFFGNAPLEPFFKIEEEKQDLGALLKPRTVLGRTPVQDLCS